MKIVSARLLDQAFSPEHLPDPGLPEVAVLGRSNVGKSSLLAAMMRRKKLVHVSSTPGKTRGIFFYIVNEQMILVDLPGYGFSRAPKKESSQWRFLVEAYLDRKSGPGLALHLIDIRHPPTRDDVVVNRILSERDIPVLVVATKADKLSRSGRLRSLAVIARDLDLPAGRVVPFSTKSAEIPSEELWSNVRSRLAQH